MVGLSADYFNKVQNMLPGLYLLHHGSKYICKYGPVARGTDGHAYEPIKPLDDGFSEEDAT